jgi:hypothetical protein
MKKPLSVPITDGLSYECHESPADQINIEPFQTHVKICIAGKYCLVEKDDFLGMCSQALKKFR